MLRARMFPTLFVAYGLVAQTPAAVEPRPVSLQEAIAIALQNNLQVQVARETREGNQASVMTELGTFDWNLRSSFAWTRNQDASRTQPIPGGAFVTSESTAWSRSFSVGADKAFGWGGSLRLSYDPSYRFSKGSANGGPVVPFTTNPYDGALSATYTQSLLRNFGRAAAESRLQVARKNAEIADFTFQRAIIDLVASIEAQYWQVVYTKLNLENKKQSLELAQKQLRENKIRVEVGTLAPIEITSAEASVAQREQEILAAEAEHMNAKDALIRALFPTNERPGDLVPTDAPVTSATAPMDEKTAERMALDRRVELKAARLDYESRQIQERAAKNRTLPQLDAYATYTGNAASQVAAEGLSAVNKDITSATYPGYTVGLQFSMPIQNRAAKGSLASARASLRASELNLRDQELGVLLEVRQALRNLETAQKTVKAFEKTRIFREKNLEAEQKKFENGMSTNFFVLQRQDELDTAKAAELRGRIDFTKAITALDKAVGTLLEARKLDIK